MYNKRVYQKKWRKEHPDYHKKYNRKYSERQRINERARYRRDRAFLWELKSKPCTDCKKIFHPCAMQFDHLKPKKNRNRTVSFINTPRVVLMEIKNCELVCANCHAVRTWTRLQHRTSPGF